MTYNLKAGRAPSKNLKPGHFQLFGKSSFRYYCPFSIIFYKIKTLEKKVTWMS